MGVTTERLSGNTDHGAVIEMRRGFVFRVDEDRADEVRCHNWHIRFSSGKPYVERWSSRRDPGGRKRIILHRWLLDAPDDRVVDHINGDTLDNRTCNLRACTMAENIRNNTGWRVRRQAYKGVSLVGQRFMARITHERRERYLGVFAAAEDAARAYDAAALELHGAFARLNFPQGRSA